MSHLALCLCLPVMIMGKAKSDQIPALFIEGKEIERVMEVKLLGVHISDDLRWESHVNALYNKVSSRLHFLKVLKRSGVDPNDLLYFYTAVIRPILEYACVVWNHNLTVKQSDKIESLQKRALRIIHGDKVFGMPYHSILFLSNIEPLHQRRAMAGKTFFESVCQETSCLNHLLPNKRDPDVISKMRHPTCYPIPYNRTKRYQSFINYALSHYQAQ